MIILLLSLACLLVLTQFVQIELNPVHLVAWAFFMFGTSVGVHVATIKASKENPNRFPTYFMAITGLKMLAYLVALGIYVFIFQKQAIPAIIGFLILYLTYTVLEVISAVRMVKKNP